MARGWALPVEHLPMAPGRCWLGFWDSHIPCFASSSSRSAPSAPPRESRPVLPTRATEKEFGQEKLFFELFLIEFFGIQSSAGARGKGGLENHPVPQFTCKRAANNLGTGSGSSPIPKVLGTIFPGTSTSPPRFPALPFPQISLGLDVHLLPFF